MCDSNNCTSTRLLDICGKVGDRGTYTLKGIVIDDYAPRVPNVCGGDYINLTVCLDCGKVQGGFPVADPLEFAENEDDPEDEGFGAVYTHGTPGLGWEI